MESSNFKSWHLPLISASFTSSISASEQRKLLQHSKQKKIKLRNAPKITIENKEANWGNPRGVPLLLELEQIGRSLSAFMVYLLY